MLKTTALGGKKADYHVELTENILIPIRMSQHFFYKEQMTDKHNLPSGKPWNSPAGVFSSRNEFQWYFCQEEFLKA